MAPPTAALSEPGSSKLEWQTTADGLAVAVGDPVPDDSFRVASNVPSSSSRECTLLWEVQCGQPPNLRDAVCQ